MTLMQEQASPLAMHQSYREQVREFVRGLVVSGKMKPETLYSVPKIAEDLNVSATPVREALLDLVREGLLKPVRNRGFQVVVMTPQERNDVYVIRLLLEVPTVGDIAAAGIERTRLEPLYELAGIVQKHAMEGETIAYLLADRQFHIALISLLDNKPLTELVGSLRDRVRLIGLVEPEAKSKAHMVKSAAEHFELLDHVAHGDSANAVAVMKRHLERSHDIWGAST